MSATPQPRIYPDSFYANGVPLPASWFQAIDTAQANAIDGKNGGTYAPPFPIFIAGQNMWLCGQNTLAAGATILTLAGKRIVHASNDVPFLLPGHLLSTDTLVTTFASAAEQTTPGLANVLPFGAIPYSSSIAGTQGTTQPGPSGRLVMPLRVHHGATFLEVVVAMAAATHVSLPAIAPSMRVYSVDSLGNVTSLGGIPGTTGYVSLLLPANAGAYSDRTFSIVYPILGGTVINRALYQYFVEVVDESGFGSVAGNGYLDATAQFSQIGSMYFP